LIEPFIILSGQSLFPNSRTFGQTTLHELSLTQSIVEIAIEHAQRENAVAIRSVTVEIGGLSGVIADAVEFAFDVCSKGTMAEGAKLEIRHTPGRGRCLECHKESGLETLTHTCPLCGSLALETVQGQEMKFTEMEID
jgi:hydrogenase nickel incorporation protein HypA/HybF